MPTVADFYHCFTSETGCCLSLTALNENQLQTSMCVYLTKSLWEKPDPNSLPAFSFFLPLLPHYVLFTPLEAAQLPVFLLFHRPTLTWLQYVSLHPTAGVYHPSICLDFLQRELVWFGKAKENSDVEDTPHQHPRWVTKLLYGPKGCHTSNI